MELRTVVLRIDDEKHGQFERAARAASVDSIGEWLRGLAEQAVAPPQFASKPREVRTSQAVAQERQVLATGKMTPAQLAAMIPGLRVGVDLSNGPDRAVVSEFEDGELVGFEEIDESPVIQAWVTKFAKWRRMQEAGQEEMVELLGASMVRRLNALKTDEDRAAKLAAELGMPK